jgi:monoamine oxidase
VAATSFAAAERRASSVGIVGAGLAGLVCADELAARGIRATIYEASSRVGGRCSSLRGFFPGQTAELGGEFIDNPHKTILGYAKRFGLAREDVNKMPGTVTYFFGGERVDESAIVDEFRAFVPAMQDDLRRSSGAPTADTHTAEDEALDRTSLREYLVTRGASARLQAVIEEAYLAEYGLEPAEQSCLNFLLFIHADRRSKFTPFGVFSDERYHLVGGNDAIATGIAARLPGQIQFGRWLSRVKRLADGRIELTLSQGPGTITRQHDVVVLAIPFTVLRHVDLHATVGLPSWKRAAIDQLGYGTNAKMMVGFTSRPWAAIRGNGTAYADLQHVQTTWETNPSLATMTRAILTDYSGGARGADLNPSQVQVEAGRFLTDLNRVFPGALAAAARSGNAYRARLEHWPSNPLTLGSYTCYRPGQFTTIAGNEGKAVGNLLFAGEHANSFYDWQGFMEGAALSGIDAAALARTF